MTLVGLGLGQWGGGPAVSGSGGFCSSVLKPLTLNPLPGPQKYVEL